MTKSELRRALKAMGFGVNIRAHPLVDRTVKVHLRWGNKEVRGHFDIGPKVDDYCKDALARAENLMRGLTLSDTLERVL